MKASPVSPCSTYFVACPFLCRVGVNSTYRLVEIKIERKISFFLLLSLRSSGFYLLLLCICSFQVASRRRGPRSS
jgi:hypothetical protein